MSEDEVLQDEELENQENEGEEKTELSELKRQFQSLCGSLSIEEIMSNTRLIGAIARFEKMLLAAGA